ncbi:GntR family transcriptional regulator [Glaciihabitans sp. dw_435]|uniref:GntR family transcriptional regulator n=1 Tax=Glaciihabitans sp. dw_435 TaxID=2720081 RepID=UPI001BD2AE4B|nr:GntR family transcriptional regulator [Glaciihabitans sp. dw_435]
MVNSTQSGLAETTEHRIVELLRARILEGQLAIGERLRQDVISAELGVSSTPVREAFRRLSAEGLLTIANHKGATVRDLSLDERIEVLDMLRLIESHNIATAVPLAGRDVIARAAEIQAQMRAAGDNAGQWATLNRDFHWALAQPSARPRALRMMGELLNLSALHVRDDIHASTFRREQALDEHDTILAAYAAGDVEATMAACYAHSTNALTRMATTTADEA